MTVRGELILQRLLGQLSAEHAQELHLIPGNPPVFRHNGELEPVKGEEALSEEFVLSLSKEYMTSEQGVILEKNREVFFTRGISSLGRYRVRIYYQKGALSLNFRRVEQEVPVLSEIGVLSEVESIGNLNKGLILVSGPYDSGRSYFAASILETINKERVVRIMTLEQSIEFIITPAKSIIEQREVGRDVKSLAAGLRALSDEDVDVIFISDVPNMEVAELVVQLSLAGKLVITTTTSDSSVRAIESFVGFDGKDKARQISDGLSDALAAVVNLRLVRNTGGHGRIYATELLLSTFNMRIAIKELDFRRVESVLYTAREQGMVTLDQNLLDLVNEGKISFKSALKVAHEVEWLNNQFGK